jgi:hypothetical protein
MERLRCDVEDRDQTICFLAAADLPGPQGE